MLKIDLPLFKYDHKPILTEIAFTLARGENLTIMGANGAGKSTLAKIICGLISTKKCVMLEGAYIETLPAARRSRLINYIPPYLEIFDPYLRVASYLRLCGNSSCAEEAMVSFGLEGMHARFVAELSSGERQLLQMACAMVHQSAMTIYDEPTANLDPRRARMVYRHFRQNGGSNIVITHTFQLAYRLRYPIYYLHDGRGTYYADSEAFFDESNLFALFGESVIKKGDMVVVNL